MTNPISIKEYIQNTAFIQSWKKFNCSSIHPLFLEYLYWLIAFFVGSFYWYRIAPMFSSVVDTAAIFQSREFTSVAEFIAQSNSLTSQWSTFKMYTIIIAFILFANYVVFKYLVWKKIINTKIPLKETAKQLGSFSLLIVGVLAVLILFLVVCYYSFVLDAFNILFFLAVPLVGVYALNLLHPLFIITGKSKNAFHSFWNIGVKKCHTFIIPYVWIGIIGIVLFMVVIPLFLFLPAVVYLVWYLICLSLYTLWIKYYLYSLIQKINKKENKQQKAKKV